MVQLDGGCFHSLLGAYMWKFFRSLGSSVGCSGCPTSQRTMEACSSSLTMPKIPNRYLSAMLYATRTLLSVMFSSLAASNVSASCVHDSSGHSTHLTLL